MRRIPALTRSKHFVADVEAGVGDGGRGAQDGAAEFGPGDPGQRGLVLVFAADLEQVEEVGCGAVDCEEVLGWGWGWSWDGGDAEVEGTLEVVKGDLVVLFCFGIQIVFGDGAEGKRKGGEVVGSDDEREGWGRLTDTYSLTWMARIFVWYFVKMSVL